MSIKETFQKRVPIIYVILALVLLTSSIVTSIIIANNASDTNQELVTLRLNQQDKDTQLETMATDLSTLQGELDRINNSTQDAGAYNPDISGLSARPLKSPTFIYPQNETTDSIIWWNESAGRAETVDATRYIYVSSEKIVRFFKQLPTSDILFAVCDNASVDLSSIMMASIDLENKSTNFGKGYSNCLERIASSQTNPTGLYAQEARQLIEEVKADIETFTASISGIKY